MSGTQHRSPSRRSKGRPGSGMWIIIISAAVLLGLIIGIIPPKTALVERELHPFTENARVYLFLDEEFAILPSGAGMDLLVEEGTKISGTTLISDTYTVPAEDYVKTKVEILDFLLSDETLTPARLYKEILATDRQAAEYDALMNEAVSSGDTVKASEYASLLEAADRKVYIMKKALQYIYIQREELWAMRERYLSMSGELPLNAESLNFSILGFVGFSMDGYENVMEMDMMDNVNAGYLAMLDSFKPQKSLPEDSFFISSTSGSRAVAVVKIPSDVFVAQEKEAALMYSDLADGYDMDSQGGYFSFIFRRMDLFIMFPEISFVTAEGNAVSGNLIKVSDDGENKLLFIGLTGEIRELRKERIFTARLITEEHNCYVVDEKSIYEDDGRYYVNVPGGAGGVYPVRVKIYRIIDGKAYLKVADNGELSEGLEILLKGRKRRDSR
ncbi:MAG: hypothetical protein J5822_03075 [Eubacteriaceae bacterium]|nr:hypothetical protein [Eubacteriaceae bacterium]